MITHSSPISGVAASENYIATAGYDNKIILWNATGNVPLSRAYHDHLANQCEISPSKNFLVSSSSDHTARVWKLPELSLVSVLTDHKDDVEMATFHPNSEMIATCSRDGIIRVFTLNGILIKKFIGHEADVISVRWINNGNQLISSSDDGTIREWDFETESQIKAHNLDGVEVDTITFTSNNSIISGDDDGNLIIIKEELTKKYSAHKAGIKRVIFDEGSQRLLSLSYDRTAKLWALKNDTLSLIAEIKIPPIIWPRSAAFMNSDTVIFGTFGSSYAKFKISTRQWQLDHIDPTLGINAVTEINDDIFTVGDAGIVWKNKVLVQDFKSLCNFLVSSNDNTWTGGQTGEIFDLKKNRVIYQHRSPLNCATAILSDAPCGYILFGAYTGEVLIFDRIGSTLTQPLITQPHQNAIKGIAYSKSLNLVATVDATGAIAFQSVADWSVVKKVSEAHIKIANDCTAVGDFGFASISRDRKLYFWNASLESEAINTPHTHSIKCIASHPDGRFIATGAYNGSIAIFDRIQKQWINVTRPTTSGISDLIYSKSRHEFIATSYDGGVYYISLTSKENIAL